MKANLFLSWALFLSLPLARGQSLELLHNFSAADGSGPSGLTFGSDGSFYGAAGTSGAGNHGAVFKVSPGGALTVLHAFASDDSEGDSPTTPVEGTNGLFYGTANNHFYCVSSGGGFTDLGTGAGGWSGSGLIRAQDGTFYGVNDSRVYQLALDGSQATLYSFPFHGALQFFPRLVQGADGSLYGVDQNGGTNSAGLIFRVNLPSGVYTELVEFNFDNGSYPTAELIQGPDGNFYGTTRNGGPGNYGTIFRMAPNGELTTLFVFHGTDGSGPQSLVLASDGSFYGTTSGGGERNAGTVFRLTPAGVFTTFFSFVGNNGSNPQAGLVQGPDGHLYGTTLQGGNYDANPWGSGTVFRVVFAPVFEPVVMANGSATFAWHLMPGQTYQLQSSTDLLHWSNAGGPVRAASSRVSFSESVGSAAQRFYRVYLTQ